MYGGGGGGGTVAEAYGTSLVVAPMRGGESTGDPGNWGSLFLGETETCMTSCHSTQWARGRMASEYPYSARDVRPCPKTVASQPFACPWTAAQCVLASMDCDTVCERSE